MRELYALKGARTVPGRGGNGNISSLFDSIQKINIYSLWVYLDKPPNDYYNIINLLECLKIAKK